MIPKTATNAPPPTTGPRRVYLPRARAGTVYWAYWSVERQQWSLPYNTTFAPMFNDMRDGGHFKWNDPSARLHWIDDETDPGSARHLARALASGA